MVVLIFSTIVAGVYLYSSNKEMEEKNTYSATKENSLNDEKSSENITINNIAQNPEGIEYNKIDKTFLLSSLNAAPILKVKMDGSHEPFTSGEKFPLSTSGLQIDYKNNRLLVAGFNGTELMDGKAETKGASFLRIYNLETGIIEKDINLSSLLPNADSYFANDIAVDSDGNAYITDWYAKAIYKVNLEGEPSIFWTNETSISSGPNGIDYVDGNLIVSILTVDEKGLYTDYGLVKIPVNDSQKAKIISFENKGFAGFDGMIIKDNGNVVGVTNNGKAPGGNTLIEITTKDNWETSSVLKSKEINLSTTVATTSEGDNYVINQDFSDSFSENWNIEKINF